MSNNSRFTGLLEDLERGSRIEDRELGIENRGSVKKKLENKINKQIKDRGNVARSRRL